MIGDTDDRVIPDFMNYVLLSQGTYPENFVLISQFEGNQEWGSIRGELGALIREKKERVVP